MSPAEEQEKPKTEKQLRKEKEKADRKAKFDEKQEKKKLADEAAQAKPKKTKAKEVVEYTAETGPGEKKGLIFEGSSPAPVNSSGFRYEP